MSNTELSSSTDTQTRLLDAAEALIAMHGVSGTSLREITEKAGVNLALVKYHFGSKEGLLESVLKRRLEPINAHRIRLLDEVERKHAGGKLPIEDVLTALIQPAVEIGLSGKSGSQFLKLFGRVFSEPASCMQLIRTQMGPMIKRFDAAFDKALPGMSGMDMAWRKMACLGVVQHSLLTLSMMDELPLHLRLPIKLLKGALRPDKVLAQLVAFCAAGIRAQVPES